MSGIEVAGVVLACIPLVFNAIDSYKSGKSQLAVWKRYGNLLQTFVRELQSQHVFFEKNLEILLKSAGVEDIDLIHFDGERSDSEWIDDADEAVRLYLGKSYGAFFQTVAAYRDVAEKVAIRMQESGTSFEVGRALPSLHRLGGIRCGHLLAEILLQACAYTYLQPGSKSIRDMLPARKQADGSFEFLKRLRFTLGKGEIQSLILELQGCNSNLTRFCTDIQRMRDIDLGAMAPNKKASRIAASLIGVRDQAQRLFAAVSAKWSSSCHSSHEANIRLEPRLERFAGPHRRLPSNRRSVEDIRFRLGLGHSVKGYAAGIQWYIAGVPKSEVQTATASVSSSKTLVRIECDDFHAKDIIGSRAQDVITICDSIAQANMGGHSLRFQVDENNTLISYLAGTAPAPILCTHSERAVSLKALMSRCKVTARPTRLSLADRMKTAITLASNLFQLSGTPWLPPGSLKDRVLFPPAELKEISGAVDVEHPFLNTSQLGDDVKTYTTRDMLLELAIVLLELWHNQTFEDYLDREEGGVQDFYERLSIAHRWLDETEQDMVPRHSKAVRSCIRSCVSQGGGFDDTVFRTEVTETVLMPLIENARDIDA